MRPYAHRSAVSGHYSGLDGLSAKEHGLLMRDTRCVTSTFGTLTERRTPTAIRTLLPKPICVYGRERVLFRVEEMLLHRYRKRPVCAHPRGRLLARLQSGDAVLRRGLRVPSGLALHPGLPPCRAPRIPRTPSGSTRQGGLCEIASRRSGASRSHCPRRRLLRPARRSPSKRCPEDGRCPPRR